MYNYTKTPQVEKVVSWISNYIKHTNTCKVKRNSADFFFSIVLFN